MPTSGTTEVSFDFADLIIEAYEYAGIEARSGYQMRTARRTFDLLTMEWANTGINLWATSFATIPTISGTATYALPATTMDVLDVLITEDDLDLYVTRVAATTYANISNKTLAGKPTEYWFRRTATPSLVLWPVPDQVYTLTYYYVRRMEDAGAYTNTPDIPLRFLPALVMGMAYRLAAKSSSPDSQARVPFLMGEYRRLLQEAQDEDREKVSLRLVPGR